MIIRAQDGFSLINFDNVKAMHIWLFDEKFRIQVKSVGSYEEGFVDLGTTLAVYGSADDAKSELERFYKAYNSGEKTFMFKDDEPEPEAKEDGKRKKL